MLKQCKSLNRVPL